MGDAEERAPRAAVARAAREESALADAACQLQTLPHHGNQPQGARIILACSWVDGAEEEWKLGGISA